MNGIGTREYLYTHTTLKKIDRDAESVLYFDVIIQVKIHQAIQLICVHFTIHIYIPEKGRQSKHVN